MLDVVYDSVLDIVDNAGGFTTAELMNYLEDTGYSEEEVLEAVELWVQIKVFEEDVTGASPGSYYLAEDVMRKEFLP